MTYENLLRRARAGAVAVVTINRPKVLNALNAATIAELDHVMRALQADDAVRAVILTGAGEKAFVAGADINELAVQTPVQGKEHAAAGQRVFDLDRVARQAGDCRHQRLRARRRLRAGDGVHAANRRRRPPGSASPR